MKIKLTIEELDLLVSSLARDLTSRRWSTAEKQLHTKLIEARVALYRETNAA